MCQIIVCQISVCSNSNLIQYIFNNMSKTKNTQPKIGHSSEEEESDDKPLSPKAKPNKKLQLQNKKTAKNQQSPGPYPIDRLPTFQQKMQPSLKTQKEATDRTANPLKRPKKQQSSEQPSDSSEEKPRKTVIKTKPAIQAEQTSKQAKKLQMISKTNSPLQKAFMSSKKKQSGQSEVEDRQSELKQDLKVSVEQKPVKAAQQAAEKQQPADSKNKKPHAVQINEQIDEEQFEICVKGLSFYALQNDVEQLFRPVGNLINVNLLTREDGKSKRIAFVKFSSKNSYNEALRLDGTQHLGRDITVQASLSKRKQNTPKFKKNNQLQTIVEITSPTIFVGGLLFNTTQQNLAAFFQQAGKVVGARIVTDKQTGKSRGFGYVQYQDLDTAKKAYHALNSKQFDGKQLRIDNATPKSKPLGTKGGYKKIQLNLTCNTLRQGSLASFRGRLEAK